MEVAVVVRNLSKTYKVQQRGEGIKDYLRDFIRPHYKMIDAVNDLSFDILQGEIVGMLGPNGAGKSTTIKMLTGVMKPTNGSISIGGMNPLKERTEYLKNIGVVFGQRSQLWWNLPVKESYKMLKDIYGVSDKNFKTKMEIFNELTEGELIEKAVRQMSLGQRVLCDIFASIIHNPSVLFLDEPTIGLDISVKDKIYDMLKKINQNEKTTIIITSHDMHDIDAMCNRVTIIDRGNLIFNDQIEKLKLFYNANKMIDIWLENKDVLDQKVMNELNNDKMLADNRVLLKMEEDGKMHLEFNDQEISSMSIVRWAVDRFEGYSGIKDINIMEVSTEAIIKQIYERK